MRILNEIAREIHHQGNNKVSTAMFHTGNVLGKITPTMKLKLDNFKHELEWLQLESVGTLVIGDRVLVAIVNNGSDHIITGKVI